MNGRERYFARVFLCVFLVGASACGGGASTSTTPTPPPPPPPPSVSIAGASVTEGDAGSVIVSLPVTLSASSTDSVTVDFATADGTAISPGDYTARSDTLTFVAGTTNQMIDITVEGDVLDESDETFTVTLSSASNATIATASATGTIIDDDGAVVVGLDSRPDNQNCVAPARPTSSASVSVVDPFPGLPNISQPTKMLIEPVANPRWFVLQKTGQLLSFDPDSATSLTTYMDLSGVVRNNFEGGLLGMAFHPDYPATPEIFLSYTIDHTGPAMRSVISRFVLDDVTTPGAGTVEEIIILVDQDFDNHNGGDIEFGPDGYLYIGLGDGGGSGDPNNRAQDTTRLLGSMLRLDVNGPGANPYNIPTDNPFAGNPLCGPGLNANDCPEIFAWGLRNPWRWSFDAATGELWAADVGQDAREEVDLIELGGNYGWRCREGNIDFNTAGCAAGGFVDPVTDYSPALGSSITGGHVYRGTAIPALIGKYVFADFVTGRFWALQPDGQGGYTNDELVDTNSGPTSFGVDEDGELYFTDFNNSRLFMIQPAGTPVPDTIPALLSNSGCVDPADITAPYAGLVPYDINAPFWSDGVPKERLAGLPNGTTITRDGSDDWQFPNGTVLIKNFRLNGNLIETRHLMRHPDGVWAGYSYEWNALQTEATRVQGGKTVLIDGQDWIFPSEGQCMQCHTSAAGFALGPETAQLNRDFTYPSTGRTANQLETLDAVTMFTTPLPGPASGLPVLTDPADTSASLDERARAYLHTNCAQCHRPGGPTPSTMDLRYTTLLADTASCDVMPQHGNLGVMNARLIAPGDAGRSLLIERTARRDSFGMPPLGSNEVDAEGIALLSNWINGLANCN